MKAVLFDLDDTLYPEIDFVRSGFRAVARYLTSRYNLDEDSLYRQMLVLLQEEGRGKVFNRLLDSLDLCTEERVKLLVYLYRAHIPTIRLYEDVLPILEHLRSRQIRLGIVTDGMASVQRRKITALGLNELFDALICTDELGQEFWKPSPIPFKVALALLGMCPSESVYVGNDPAKDFGGPNEIGMVTIRVDRCYQGEVLQNSGGTPSCAKWIVGGLKDILPFIRVKGA